MARWPLSFDHPWLLLPAAGIVLLAICVARWRGVRLPRSAQLGAIAAMGLLGLAVGGLVLHLPRRAPLVVMVDLSASTRGAMYRESAFLQRRIGQLLGAIPRRIIYFGQENHKQVPQGAVLGDLPSENTVFAPPTDALAILAFTDCRFELPENGPPTYVVVDPGLEDAADAAVENVWLRGKHVAAMVRNSAEPRELSFIGTTETATHAIDTGSFVLTAQLTPGSSVAGARFGPVDIWPENDSLSIPITPPLHSQLWWVGESAPSSDWRVIGPEQLPTAASDYLAPAAIVLNNVPAPALSSIQIRRLYQYVRDLGGALVILGGDRAFAAGDYSSTPLDDLSPLSSSPPVPLTHWIILADSSGSMAQIAGGKSRWEIASDAAIAAVASLPPEDPVSIGSFAAELTWWSRGKTVRDTAALPLPPTAVVPSGPTNLAAALEDVLAQAPKMPTNLLLITDAQAVIDEPDALAIRLKSHQIRVHLLAIGEGAALPVLRQITRETGGTVVEQFDPAGWADAATALVRGSVPERLLTSELTVHFLGDAAARGERGVWPWNRTWIKEGATALATAQWNDATIHPAARWRFGSGQVLAASFAASAGEGQTLAELVASPPRDPRFTVTWETAPDLRLTIDAVDQARYLNDLRPTVRLASADDPSRTISAATVPQVGPGRYELTMPAPRQAVIATVLWEEEAIDRVAMAGRYPKEFYQIGNDVSAMRQLARRTGGAVVTPPQQSHLSITFPTRRVDMTGPLAVAGAALLAFALIRWRLA